MCVYKRKSIPRVFDRVCGSMASKISKYSFRNKKRQSSGKDVDEALRDDAGTANVTVRAKQAHGDHAKC